LPDWAGPESNVCSELKGLCGIENQRKPARDQQTIIAVAEITQRRF
jgi:hypothetical protein